MAHLIGDGCVLPRHVVQYTTGDRELAEIVVNLAEAVTEHRGSKVNGRISEERTWLQVYLAKQPHKRHNPISEWFREMGIFGLRSYEKRIPDEVMCSPAKDAAWFLRHLWSTDGTFTRQKRPSRGNGINRTKEPKDIATIAYSTSSPVMAGQVQHLLQVCGVNSRLGSFTKPGTKENYRIEVVGASGQRAFIKKIGTVGQRRGSQLNSVADLLLSIGDGNTERNGVYYDLVRGIENAGSELVYDLTVPGTHNFIANGIVTHNSLEQDADMVIFLNRPEVYDPDDRPGEADLTVAKNRNGPKGVATLAWIGKSMRFESIERNVPDFGTDFE